ncbi:hypothetical protein HPP92_007971 [Vanilla planifolia]|uniref:ALBINO3-like protein 2, chloroplastic n=1 Tax=Vanilla planifolia TaxID=51239 RepID=A0A835V9X1_VANPL|nr:hypothetical protein HPP92_007971 [Vanilla planifolia]
MGTAVKILRQTLRRSRYVFPSVILRPLAPSSSSFSPQVLFHRARFIVNPYWPSTSCTVFFDHMSRRNFSWFTWRSSIETSNPEGGSEGSFEEGMEFSPLEVLKSTSEPPPVDVEGCTGIYEGVFDDGKWYYYPTQTVISMLDGFHELTRLPWWLVISASTLGLRVSLLPVLIFQLKKMAKLGQLLPRLPPPFPPPLSGKGFREQYLLFLEKRKELGCPSYLWNFAFFIIQFPCFLLWMTSIRKMCLDHHPGFESGGVLWFQNLTLCPNGAPCFIFPALVAGLHFINVQISFRTIKFAKLQGILGFLAKYYKLYLDILSVPLFLIGFFIPQGSLIYWVTNSLLTLTQQLCLRNSSVRNKLGLPNLASPLNKRISTEAATSNDTGAMEIVIPIEAVPSEKLLDLALQDMAVGDQDKALILLRNAIDKDPELVRALIAIGQILCSKRSFAEASEYYERAIPKILEEEIGLLVLSRFGAGVSRIWQGRNPEGIEHLKKIAELRVPDNPVDKSCYYRGLVMLGSTLFQEGEKAEAAKYLRIAAAYDPSVNAYVKECEEESNM